MQYDTALHYEVGNRNEQLRIRIRDCLYSAITPYQEIKILDSDHYGKMLLLDGLIQSTELDEYRYHESLVHPAMCAHPDPKSVLIIGGGEGASAREVLKHPSVQRLVMVDIDGILVDTCKQYLAEWHGGAFFDQRFELVVQDGLDYVHSCTEEFDVIIVDVCDGFGPDATALEFFQKRYFTALKRILELRGVLAYQGMSAQISENEDFARVYQGLKQVFTYTDPYSSYIPSFAAQWGFVVASDVRHMSIISNDMIDTILCNRRMNASLRYFDGTTFRHMLALPLDIRTILEDQNILPADESMYPLDMDCNTEQEVAECTAS